MIPLVLFIFGVILCIGKQRGWGLLCFLLAMVCVLAML